MSFSQTLRAEAADVWEAQHAHPFVTGIGDGTLPLDRFRFWVAQDYVYLIDYARLLALGAARAPDLATMRRLATLAEETLGTEMDLHRTYAAELGITADELERTHAAPATRAYVDFLLRTAALGDFGELLAALLPCMWGFSEVGQRLAARPDGPPAEPRYAAWIEMYASDEFDAARCLVPRGHRRGRRGCRRHHPRGDVARVPRLLPPRARLLADGLGRTPGRAPPLGPTLG